MTGEPRQPADRRKTRERRTAGRVVPANLHAQLLMELDSSIVTLSSAGMGVRLAFAPPLDSVHRFVLDFGERVVDVRGAVRNVTREDAAGSEAPAAAPSFLVGIFFVGVRAEDEKFLQRFVAERARTPG